MALGSHVPEWKALQAELQRLGDECSAHLVAVISTGNVLWCASRTDGHVDGLANDFYRSVIAPRRQQLRRGERVNLVQRGPAEARVACSFAGIYVLVLWIAVGKIVSISRGQVTRSDLDEDGVGAAMRRAMPKIEALTLSLPPPNPEPAEGAGKQHA